MHMQSIIVPLSPHAFLPGRIRAVAALHLQFCMDGKGIRKMTEELVRRIRHLSASGLFSAQGQTGQEGMPVRIWIILLSQFSMISWIHCF
jgi:hypothetical protein